MPTISLTAPRMEAYELKLELESLPPEEKERAKRDIYGDDAAVEESVEMIRSSLRNVQTALQAIPDDQKVAYLQALERCPQYVNSMEFQLMFLRAECFDVQAAANRIVRYWQEKLALFGEDITFRKTSLRDMSEAEHERALRQGGVQVLPGTDEAGRAVIYSDRPSWEHRISHRRSMLKAAWYILHTLLDVTSVQKNGIVLLVISTGQFQVNEFDRKVNNAALRMVREIVPLRVVGVQHVIRSSVVSIIMPFVFYAMGPRMRMRYKAHYGSDAQIIEDMKKVGISIDQLPSVVGGRFVFQYERWLEQRRLQEANDVSYQQENEANRFNDETDDLS